MSLKRRSVTLGCYSLAKPLAGQYSMDFAQKIHNRASVDLATFLDHHGCRLPRTVKLADGFCGTNEDDTLEADKFLVFFKVEWQKTVVAIDQLGQEICMQQNSGSKVHLLPPECHKLYETARELLTAQSSYFLVLEDIPSLRIVSGSKLILPSNQRSISNYLKCQVFDNDDSREVVLPLHLTGRFLPLLDATDYYLDEVLARNQPPVNIRFVSQSTRANDRLSAQSLSSLGNIRLTSKTEVEMVFAASFDNELSLYVFPKTLDITVSCGFKFSAETSKKVKECRQALDSTEMSLKRLDDVIKGSFYFTACPVRRFSLRSLKMSPTPLPRPIRTEQGKFAEEGSESTVRDHIASASFSSRSFLRSQKPISGELPKGNYENCETGEMSVNFTDSRSIEEINERSAASEVTDESIYTKAITDMELPPIPPKLRLPSTADDEDTNAQPEQPSRPVPKPRKPSNVRAKADFQEKMTKECAPQIVQTRREGDSALECTKSAQGPITSTEENLDETRPELPPRPIFLQAPYITSGEEIISHEDNPPPLPPKNVMDGSKAYLDQVHTEDEEYEQPIEDEECEQPIEDEEYEQPISPSETPPPLPRRNEYPPPLPARNESFDKPINIGLAYLAVDVTDWRRIEEKYGAYCEVKDDGRVFKQDEVGSSYIDVIYDPDEKEEYQVTKGQKSEDHQPDAYKSPCDDTEWLRSEAHQQVEEKRSEEDQPYEEIEDWHESSQTEFRWENNAENQVELGLKKTEGNSRHKGIVRSEEAIQNMETLQLRRAGMESNVAQQVEDESSDDDHAYEEMEYSHEISPREFRMGKKAETPRVKNQSENSSSNNVNSSSSSSSSSTSSSGSKSKKNNTECSAQTVASRPRNYNKIWISARREEDLMDFKDIEQFFKLRKELDATRAKVEVLQKQVASKEQDPTERTHPLPDRNGTASSSSPRNVGNSQHIEKNSKDGDDSVKVPPKQAKRTSHNRTGFGRGSEMNMGKVTPSLAPENMVP